MATRVDAATAAPITEPSQLPVYNSSAVGPQGQIGPSPDFDFSKLNPKALEAAQEKLESATVLPSAAASPQQNDNATPAQPGAPASMTSDKTDKAYKDNKKKSGCMLF